MIFSLVYSFRLGSLLHLQQLYSFILFFSIYSFFRLYHFHTRIFMPHWFRLFRLFGLGDRASYKTTKCSIKYILLTLFYRERRKKWMLCSSVAIIVRMCVHYDKKEKFYLELSILLVEANEWMKWFDVVCSKSLTLFAYMDCLVNGHNFWHEECCENYNRRFLFFHLIVQNAWAKVWMTWFGLKCCYTINIKC